MNYTIIGSVREHAKNEIQLFWEQKHTSIVRIETEVIPIVLNSLERQLGFPMRKKYIKLFDPILRLANFQSRNRYLQKTLSFHPLKRRLNSPHGGMIALNMNAIMSATLPRLECCVYLYCLPPAATPSRVFTSSLVSAWAALRAPVRLVWSLDSFVDLGRTIQSFLTRSIPIWDRCSITDEKLTEVA